MSSASEDDKLDKALLYLRTLPSGQSEPRLPIAKAAIALSVINDPRQDTAPAEALLDRIATTAAQHAQTGHNRLPAEAQVAVIRDLLHLQFGFRGDIETYDDLQNCDMCGVLERRQGLPVALCILAMHIGDALDIDTQGVGLPGHFLLTLKHEDGDVIFDPFDQCRILSEDEIIGLLDRVGGHHQGLDSLVPATRRDVLVRLENNRKTRLIRQSRYEEALVVQEAMLILQPDQFTLWYEACLIATETHNYHSAVKYLEQAMLLTDDAGLIANLSALRQQIKGNVN